VWFYHELDATGGIDVSRSPVGRRTGQYLLSALELSTLASFFPCVGFTPALRELAARQGVILVETGDLARP
jgi:hypothetical protein